MQVSVFCTGGEAVKVLPNTAVKLLLKNPAADLHRGSKSKGFPQRTAQLLLEILEMFSSKPLKVYGVCAAMSN